MSNVHERLRRLLFLVPYVSKHPGVTVEALARALNISREDLLEELDLLTCVGRPPFNPDDYIDIYVDNDRVYVDLDQRLFAPPRLTAGEAAALAAAAELLRPATGDALQSALTKLEGIIPPAARERFRDMYRKIDASADAPPALGPLTRAILERLEVTFGYASPGRPTEPRRVRPYELLSHRGQWYLQGFCHTRQDARLFRLDRMEDLAVTPTAFQPPPDARADVPNPARSASEASVRVRFTPTAAPYVKERFGQDARPLADGGVEVRVAGDSERWLTQWVLSFGGEAEVLEPASARAAVARAVHASIGS
ncbi:helix-turn-helix transcriptional regulator [Corallococcus sp. RDP092CA]|uniref:helix-turn-helix transcriptional regulator n=1 Tax=Corallococcus sp. RDP092CA TaxID=3109369 RepID=UPI0035AE1FE1